MEAAVSRGPGDVRIEERDEPESLLPLTDVMATGHHAAVSVAVEEARALTDGGANRVLECVGAASVLETAAQVVRPGGRIGYVGVPRVESAEFLPPPFYGNASFTGGPAPVRNYAEEPMDDVLQRRPTRHRSSRSPWTSTASPRDTRRWTSARRSK